MLYIFRVVRNVPEIFLICSATSQVSDIEIQRLFRRAVAPDTTINIAHDCFEFVSSFSKVFLKSLLEDTTAASAQRESFKWHKLLEEGDQRILLRALDCLMAVDTRCHGPGLFRADNAPSLLGVCHSLGHRTLAMQLALGLPIDELAAPQSARQVSWSKGSGY